MDMKVALTIGYERRHQELLAIEDQDEFVTRTTASLGPQPPNFENIVALNQEVGSSPPRIASDNYGCRKKRWSRALEANWSSSYTTTSGQCSSPRRLGRPRACGD
jgi:hypothetical protein